ncbi:mitochondrial carnitine/acylcarnitine carrier protein-like isoform X1 [Asterias amurensis]|uniref:mitochondrial carnitine/acylcarnitine carrier protein-like isoform X1 n=2 Tax=Asterias amurensis TaxID=7602 RepID=UPI003AB37BE7
MADDIDLAGHFISGGFGGMCALITGHPLDTIKLRLQTQPAAVTGISPIYSGMADCARKIYLGEGFSGLYKGMLAPLAMAMPISALSFTGFAMGKKLQTPSSEDGRYSLAQIFLSGMFSACFFMTVCPACERVKCLLQAQKSSGKTARFSGVLDCMRQIYKEAGLVRGLYKGTFITCIRDFPGMGFYFLTYEVVLRSLESFRQTETKSKRAPSLMQSCLAGGCAGFGYWSCAIGPDTVKSRLQTAPEGTYPNGARDVVREIWKKEGVSGFFKGSAPVFLRAMPASAAQFIGFEIAMKFLHQSS